MMDSCKQRVPLCVEATRERWTKWKAKPEIPDPYPGLIPEQQYFEQLDQYMQLATQAAFIDKPAPRTLQKPSRNCLPPEQMAARTPQLSTVRQARLYQGIPFRQGPDVRHLLASVVYLPADREAAAVPVYSREQVESAHLRPGRGTWAHKEQVAQLPSPRAATTRAQASGAQGAEAISGLSAEASRKLQPGHLAHVSSDERVSSSDRQPEGSPQEVAAGSRAKLEAVRVADSARKAEEEEEPGDSVSVPEKARASNEAKDAGPGSSSRLPGSIATDPPSQLKHGARASS